MLIALSSNLAAAAALGGDLDLERLYEYSYSSCSGWLALGAPRAAPSSLTAFGYVSTAGCHFTTGGVRASRNTGGARTSRRVLRIGLGSTNAGLTGDANLGEGDRSSLAGCFLVPPTLVMLGGDRPLMADGSLPRGAGAPAPGPASPRNFLKHILAMCPILPHLPHGSCRNWPCAFKWSLAPQQMHWASLTISHCSFCEMREDARPLLTTFAFLLRSRLRFSSCSSFTGDLPRCLLGESDSLEGG